VRRLGPFDKLLLWTLLPVWVVCFSLHVRELVRTGLAQVPVYVTPAQSALDYPVVASFHLESQGQTSGLELGDRVLRIGETDLRGAGFVDFNAITLEEAASARRVEVEVERRGARQRLSLMLPTLALPWWRIPLLLAMLVAATGVLLRSARPDTARLFFAALLMVAVLETPFAGGSRLQSQAAQLVFLISGPVGLTLVLRWVIGFPAEVPASGRISPAWSWLGLLWVLPRLNFMTGGPLPTSTLPVFVMALDGVYIAGAMGVLTYNYRRADPVGRRRVKWLLLGSWVGLVPMIVTLTLPLVDPGFEWFDELFALSGLATVAVPLGLLIGVLRFQLFDVDRLIGSTASYTVLAGLGVLGAALVIWPVAALAAHTFGIDPLLGQLALCLALVAAAVPTQRQLRPRIDRLLFPERHATLDGLRQLGSEVSAVGDPRARAEHLGERLTDLLRPEHCALYWREREDFALIFERGGVRQGQIPARSPLVAALRGRTTPLASDGTAPGPEGRLAPFERATLEALAASLVVPIRLDSRLAAILCLGPKRSGDIYTSAELEQLGALTAAASAAATRSAHVAASSESLRGRSPRPFA
jgi:hypothetical protein